jgi:hypothetical protein
MTTLSWSWISFQLAVPTIVALVVAYPFWRHQQPIFGNLMGAVVLFGTGIALILREYTVIDRAVRACLDEGTSCFPQPSAFTRFAIYAFIALAQVIALFMLSLWVEERIRRRGYAAEWR